MLFNSYIFLLLFLPVTLVGYYAFNKFNKFNISNIWLLIMSLVFYAYFNIDYLPIIVSSIVVNYFISKILSRQNNRVIRIPFFVLSIIFNVGILFYFKYFDFFISNINSIFSTDFLLKNLVLPLGISFFTFQQLSYVIDAYKRDVPEYNFIDYALFVTFFPQLIAGPIVLHNEIVPQFANKEKRKLNYENFSKGLYAFAFGLGKKVLIADIFGKMVNLAFADTDYFLNTTNGILIMLAYTIQIYFDFSGYCDMSTGLGCMFNIDIPMNFNSPYKAITISEFWKRWHITLTRFFTTYLYIPLGGNRKGKFRTYFNNLVVFLVSGIWHGANWTFILWGMLHGIAVVLNKLFDEKLKKFPKTLLWVMTFGFVNVAWLLFRADSIHQFLFIMKNFVFMNFELPSMTLLETLFSSVGLYFKNLIGAEWITYVYVGLLMSFALVASISFKNTNEKLVDFKPNTKTAIITSVLFVWSILSFSEVSTFLYFNF